MLEQDRVADDQVGPGEPRHLVVGVIPRHDPEDQPVGAAAHQRGALALQQVDRLIGQQLLGVVGVVLVDSGREVDLAQRLLDRLAHLADDDLGQLLALGGVDLGHLADHRCAVSDGGGRRPLLVARVRATDGVLEITVGDRRVLLDRLAGRRVHNCVVSHVLSSACRQWFLCSTPQHTRWERSRAIARSQHLDRVPAPSRPGVTERHAVSSDGYERSRHTHSAGDRDRRRSRRPDRRRAHRPGPACRRRCWRAAPRSGAAPRPSARPASISTRARMPCTSAGRVCAPCRSSGSTRSAGTRSRTARCSSVTAGRGDYPGARRRSVVGWAR